MEKLVDVFAEDSESDKTFDGFSDSELTETVCFFTYCQQT